MSSISTLLSLINPFESVTDLSKSIESKGEIEIQIGSSNFLVDTVRNIFSIPKKIFLLNAKVNSGNVSENTINKMREYLDENGLHDVAVSVTQYKPGWVWSRIFSNSKTSTLSKCTIGIIEGIIASIPLSKLIGRDRYNPSANMIHLFSDDISLALHECGRAKDFNERANPTLYRLTCKLPIVGRPIELYQKYKADSSAINYLRFKGLDAELKQAFKVLIPAFALHVALKLLPSVRFVQSEVMNRVITPRAKYAMAFVAILVSGHLMSRAMAAAEKPVSKPVENPPEQLAQIG